MSGNNAATWERDWRASIARQLLDLSKQQQTTAVLLERLSNHFDDQDAQIKDARERIKALEEQPERRRELAISARGVQSQLWSVYIAGAAILIAVMMPIVQAHWH